MNAREWKQNQARSKELFEFLTQSRKHATDCIFITQAVENLDGQVARLALYTWTFRDLQTWKLDFKLFKLKYPLKQYLVQQWDYTGKDLFDRRFEYKDKAIFPLYDTTQMIREIERSGTVQKRQRSELAERVRKKKKRRLLIGFALAAVTVVVLVAGCVTHGKTRDTEETTPTELQNEEKHVQTYEQEQPEEIKPVHEVQYLEITTIYKVDEQRPVAFTADGRKWTLGQRDYEGYYVVSISPDRIYLHRSTDGSTREILHASNYPPLPIISPRGDEALQAQAATEKRLLK